MSEIDPTDFEDVQDPFDRRSKSALSFLPSEQTSTTPPTRPGATKCIRSDSPHLRQSGEPDDDMGAPGDNIKDPDAWKTCEDLVNRLMNLPNAMKNPKGTGGEIMQDRVMIKLDWVKKVTEKHFIFNPAMSRSVLHNDSKLRTHGKLYRLPNQYHEWLCGSEVTGDITVTQNALWMARRDFKKVGSTCLAFIYYADALND
ncbi:hypothetical protein FB567DRAFT_596568 [Paraphoma chrysanthemicola]|uniref:Uncharacterized protein n=1 Tax=Paraphoma chrysanthemicola TaxID=798071 RepID=A0A8K0QXU0_9PLEO|nr:hypothetical protein FB567DRAFT_596568 [Paraphoma chrysanthemicola]